MGETKSQRQLVCSVNTPHSVVEPSPLVLTAQKTLIAFKCKPYLNYPGTSWI